jgi:hypothetical protein
VRVENVSQIKGHRGATDKISALARIKIQHHRLRTVELAGSVQERMQLQVCNVGAPYQRRQIVGADIADGLAASLPGYIGGMEPFRRMLGRVLFVKRLSAHAIREPFHRHQALPIVRKHPWRDTDIVIDDLSLVESVSRIERLVEIA